MILSIVIESRIKSNTRFDGRTYFICKYELLPCLIKAYKMSENKQIPIHRNFLLQSYYHLILVHILQTILWPAATFFFCSRYSAIYELLRLNLEKSLFPILRYFRDTIFVDLSVPLSFPVFILSFFVTHLSKCNDLNCTLSLIVNFL